MIILVRHSGIQSHFLSHLATCYNTGCHLERKFYHLKAGRSWLRTARGNTACNSGSHWLLYHTGDIPVGIYANVTTLLSLTTLLHLQCCNIIACSQNIHFCQCSSIFMELCCQDDQPLSKLTNTPSILDGSDNHILHLQLLGSWNLSTGQYHKQKSVSETTIVSILRWESGEVPLYVFIWANGTTQWSTPRNPVMHTQKHMRSH